MVIEESSDIIIINVKLVDVCATTAKQPDNFSRDYWLGGVVLSFVHGAFTCATTCDFTY